MRTPTIIIIPAAVALASCATSSVPAGAPADAFFAHLTTLCGKTVEGRLMTESAADAAYAGKRLIARGGDCTANEVRIAFEVGDDRSRTWIISRQPGGLRLKHRHMLPDSTEDPVSQYGGDTIDAGTAVRQQFPADAYSKDMFTRRGMTVSLPNVWAFEIVPGETLTYELARPGRLFRVSFDLRTPASS